MFSTLARRLAPRIILAEAAMVAGVLLAVTACSSGSPVASKTRAEPVVPLATSSVAATPSTAATPSSAPKPDKSEPVKSKPEKSDPPAVPLGPFTTSSEVKALFVALVEKYCGPAYGDGTETPVDPKAATVRRGPTKNEWLVTDKSGDKMLINTSSKRVYSTQGPDGSLPGDYTFGCDGVVFPGTWD